jgi:hypothetical protein
MVLSAILKLDAGAFTTPLGKAVEGIKSAIRIGAEMGEKLQAAFDAGGALKDLSDQTGELPGTLMVLKQAFQDTGVGAESVGQTLALMRKSLAGVSETGEPTGKMFQQLGLDIEALKGMSATDQLKTIGAAIKGLKTPAEQTTAAMGIFGKSGNRMMGFIKDAGALDAAAASLGGLPALMDRNARAFDEVSDRMAHIKAKGQGLWAGIAEGLLPLADGVTAALDGIDLSGIGQRIGAFLGSTVQLFKAAPLGQTLKDGLWIGFSEAVNMIAAGWNGMFLMMIDAMAPYLVAIKYTFIAAAAMIKEAFSATLHNRPVQSPMPGIIKDAKDELSGIKLVTSLGLSDTSVKLLDNSEAKARSTAAWTAAAADYEAKIAALQAKANAGGKGTGTDTLAGFKSGKAGKAGVGGPIPADALTRIGGYMGGGGRRLESLSERTAKATERMANHLERQQGFKIAWGI